MNILNYLENIMKTSILFLNRVGVTLVIKQVFNPGTATSHLLQTRLYSDKSRNHNKNPIDDPKSKVAKHEAVKTIQTLLEINTFNAYEVTMKSKMLLKTNPHIIKGNFDKCIQNGITKSTLMRHPQLLCDPSIDEKMDKIRTLPYEINTVAALMSMPLKKIEAFVINSKKLGVGQQRIATISKILNVSIPSY